MKQVLITGGTGYIGSHTAVALHEAGYEPILLDNLDNSTEKVVDGVASIIGKRPIFERVELCDMQAVRSFFAKYPAIDTVIHFAAHKAVGESVENPLKYYQNNLISLINLLQILKEKPSAKIVFSSSCTIYGQPEQLPVTEDAPVQPAASPYGNTKQICEEILRDVAQPHPHLHVLALRYFNPIGAHPSAAIGELPNGVPNNLVPFITQTAIGKRSVLKVFGSDYNTPDGSCIRDYINVCDLADAHVKAMHRLERQDIAHPFEAFNVGTGNGESVLGIIKSFEKAAGVPVPHELSARRAGDIEKIWADPTLAQDALGWKAKYSMEDTLKSAWKWEQKLAKQ